MRFWAAIVIWLAGTICLHAAAARYRVVPLEVPLNTNYSKTEGYTINDSGMVAGIISRQFWAPYLSGSTRGIFIHTPQEGFVDIGDYIGLSTQPSRINNNGKFTVYAYGWLTTNGVLTYVQTGALFSTGSGFEQVVGLGGPVLSVLGMNSQDRVVGRAQTPDRVDHAFLYDPLLGMRDLGTFGGPGAAAIDINDQGWISGTLRQTNGLQAFLYHPDHGLTVLGPGRALRVNEQRTVLCDNNNSDPILIKTNGQSIHIAGAGGIAPDPNGDLNDWNVVVGTGTRVESGRIIGYVWTESEGIRDLNQLIETNSGWSILDTYSLNNRGQMTCAGWLEGRAQAIRLDPITPKLAIYLTEETVVLSWTNPWPAGVALESATDLAFSLWSPVPNVSSNSVTLARTNQTRFFRLDLSSLRGLCCVPE